MTTLLPADLIRNACFAADTVAIGFTGTGADKTRAIIERALEALEANGMIKIIPEEEWPQWFIPDPPYTIPCADTSVQGEPNG